MNDANAGNANSADANWIDAWLETQRGWLGRWQSVSMEQRTDAMRAGMEALRQHLDPQAIAPEALNLAHSFQQLLQASLQASGEWARLQTEGQGGMPEWLSMPALGPHREQQLAWQTLMRAQLDYQIRLQALLGGYAQVFTESLEAVPRKVAERTAQGRPIQGFRDLHEVWIECGEAAFAKMARDEFFIATQAACINALSALKQAQGMLIEQWLRAHDLPTRSELNGVHQRLRDLQASVATLTERLNNATRVKAATAARRQASQDRPDE